ncbi:hypothetical protein COO60DRAFT_1489897, partial [Scenedesmus sp. NREL 46B-D3]
MSFLVTGTGSLDIAHAVTSDPSFRKGLVGVKNRRGFSFPYCLKATLNRPSSMVVCSFVVYVLWFFCCQTAGKLHTVSPLQVLLSTSWGAPISSAVGKKFRLGAQGSAALAMPTHSATRHTATKSLRAISKMLRKISLSTASYCFSLQILATPLRVSPAQQHYADGDKSTKNFQF